MSDEQHFAKWAQYWGAPKSDRDQWVRCGGGYRHITAFVVDGATVGERATVGQGATVGEWAKVGQGATVGERATVGQGMRVDKDASVQIRGIGSRGVSVLLAALQPDGTVMASTGCWSGTLDELESRVANTYEPGHRHRIEYDAAIAMIRAVSRTWKVPAEV